jgi:DNA polymerase I-like protein with 3'-5' exonuclease and polymerase domains
MGADKLAERINLPRDYATDLINLHRKTYAGYWAWSERAQNYAMMYSRIQAVFGWTWWIGQDANPRSIRNFPCQANGAELLRLACCLATERGIRTIAPVHDAVMIEAPIDSIDHEVVRMQQAMSDASAIVLDGPRLRSDAKIVRWPDRFSDKRGREFWDKVMGLIMQPMSR